MQIKPDLQGTFIYAAMTGYLAAFLATILKRKQLGQWLYRLGFAAVAGGWIYRWIHVEHVPFQNLFEVFLTLGMIYPLSWLCRRALRIDLEAADMLIGVIVLFPAGFVFNHAPQKLPPALQSGLFAPHVAAYMIAYILMAKATVQAIAHLAGADRNRPSELLDHEQATYRLIGVGFAPLTLGLILGSVWAKLAWGDYWGWDPKELWSLASWLIYLGYFHFRAMYGKRYARTNSIWAIVGMGVIIITLLWVNLSKLFGGLHSYAR